MSARTWMFARRPSQVDPAVTERIQAYSRAVARHVTGETCILELPRPRMEQLLRIVEWLHTRPDVCALIFPDRIFPEEHVETLE